jgi:hypothetical protein
MPAADGGATCSGGRRPKPSTRTVIPKASRSLERKVLWLASWTIHHANHVRENADGLKVGGHQASSTSLATIMTALYFRILRPQDRNPMDGQHGVSSVPDPLCDPAAAPAIAAADLLWRATCTAGITPMVERPPDHLPGRNRKVPVRCRSATYGGSAPKKNAHIAYRRSQYSVGYYVS